MIWLRKGGHVQDKLKAWIIVEYLSLFFLFLLYFLGIVGPKSQVEFSEYMFSSNNLLQMPHLAIDHFDVAWGKELGILCSPTASLQRRGYWRNFEWSMLRGWTESKVPCCKNVNYSTSWTLAMWRKKISYLFRVYRVWDPTQLFGDYNKL